LELVSWVDTSIKSYFGAKQLSIMGRLKVHVIYCGAWGYAPKFYKLQQEIVDAFGADVEVTGEGTPQSTGWLEVQIVGGKSLHSKKNGDGYVDSPAKLQKILNGIKEAM